MIYRHQTDRLVIVPYDDLLTYPTQTLNKLYDQLGLPRYAHDFINIKQTIDEDDMMHGFAPEEIIGMPVAKLHNKKQMDEHNKAVNHLKIQDFLPIVNSDIVAPNVAAILAGF